MHIYHEAEAATGMLTLWGWRAISCPEAEKSRVDSQALGWRSENTPWKGLQEDLVTKLLCALKHMSASWARGSQFLQDSPPCGLPHTPRTCGSTRAGPHTLMHLNLTLQDIPLGNLPRSSLVLLFFLTSNASSLRPTLWPVPLYFSLWLFFVFFLKSPITGLKCDLKNEAFVLFCFVFVPVNPSRGLARGQSLRSQTVRSSCSDKTTPPLPTMAILQSRRPRPRGVMRFDVSLPSLILSGTGRADVPGGFPFKAPVSFTLVNPFSTLRLREPELISRAFNDHLQLTAWEISSVN